MSLCFTKALTLGAGCFKFLCVVGLMHRLSHFSRRSAKFMSHDGWHNSARSWILSFKPGSHGFQVIPMALFFSSDLIADSGLWYFPGGGVRKRLPKFKFSAKFPIGLHVILQIQIKKIRKWLLSYVKNYFNRKSVEVQPCTSLEIMLNGFCLKIIR